MKNPKNLLGVFAQVKTGLKNLFHKRDILSKHPQTAKNGIKSLRNLIFAILFNFYWRDLSKTQLFRKWNWHFPFK